MALLYLDSFAGYATANVAQRYDLIYGTPSIVTVNPDGNPVATPRTGPQMLLTNPGSDGVGKAIPGNIKSVIQGVAVFDPNSTPSTGQPIFVLTDVAGNPMIALFSLSTGALAVYTTTLFEGEFSSGIGSVLLGQSPDGTLPRNAWTMIEWKVTASTTASGSVTVYVSGVPVITATNVITANLSNDGFYVSSVTSDTLGFAYLGTPVANYNLVATALGSYVYFNDYYIFDQTGVQNNAPAGDIKVEAVFPAAPGRVTAWAKTPAAAANWAAVNSVPPSTTTDVSSATIGATDAYALSALATVPSVRAVQASIYSSKSTSGSRTVGIGVGNGSAESFDAGHALLTSSKYYLREMDANPLTAAPWAFADFATLQAAIKVVA